MKNVNAESKKPGVMIYFEILPALENLWWWQRFALLEAMIYYARDKRLPKFRGALRAVWEIVQPIVDRDDQRYHSTLEARRKAGKARGKQIQEEAMERRAQQDTQIDQAAYADAEKQCISAETSYAEHMLSELECAVEHNSSKSSQSTISNPQSPNINPQSTISNPQSAFSNPQSPRETPQLGGVMHAPGVEEVRAFVEREGLWVNPETFVAHYGARCWTVDGRPIQDWRALAKKWDSKERMKKGKR